MTITREVKTAILVLSGIALFVVLFSFLKGENLFSKADTYYTEFDYNALNPSSAVTVKGNKVGKIESIKYNFETGKTRVEFSVDPKLKFSKASVIRLYETGLMGGNALAIVSASGGDIAKPGDFLNSEVEPGLVASLKTNFSGISTNLDSTVASADSLMTNLNALVVDESEQGLKQTIRELNTTLKSFKNLSFTVKNVVDDNDEKIASVLTNVKKTSENLYELSTNLKTINVAGTVENLNSTLTNIQKVIARIDNSDGTLGKLLNDASLYDNLESASKEMELLLLDIKLHPARYRRILSKKEIPYQTPSKDQKK